MDLVFTVPDADSPGFLRRQRDALRFSRLLQEDPNDKVLDEMIGFLAQFVTQPAEHEEAVDALLDASENQFKELLTSITAGAMEAEGNPTQ